jgi:hypothetical protein
MARMSEREIERVGAGEGGTRYNGDARVSRDTWQLLIANTLCFDLGIIPSDFLLRQEEELSQSKS